jgi:hypothetical protein
MIPDLLDIRRDNWYLLIVPVLFLPKKTML